MEPISYTHYGGMAQAVPEQPQPINVPTCDAVVDLTVIKGEELCTTVLSIIRTLFPEWASHVNAVSLDRVSGALTNAVFFVNAPNRRRMLLRVYGIGCDQIVDRPNELFWLSRLSTLHMGPALLGIFGNGRFEEYLDSTTLTHCAIRDPTTSQQIGGCLRRMHDIVHVYPPMAGEDTEVWRNIKKWHAKVVDLLPEMSRKDSRWDLVLKRVKLGKLSMEIDACREILNQLQSPIVFSHNDTQYGNILRLENTGALVLVDFEYAGYNPRGYDIANHFCEWMYNYHSKHPDAMEPSQFPVYEERVRFCKAYLEAGRDMNTTPEALEKEVSSWLMGSHLFWGLWGLIQASQSDIDFDYFSYSMQRLDSFQEELERCLIK